jgi:hypothetical protein
VLVGGDAKALDLLVRFLGAWYQPLTTLAAKRNMGKGAAKASAPVKDPRGARGNGATASGERS